MKVLHINSNYLTSKLHENLIDRLETSFDNYIYMPTKLEKKDEIIFKSKHKVYSPVVFRDVDKYIFTLKQAKIYKNLLNTFNIEEFDLIHAHTLFTDGNIAYLLNKKFGKKYIVTVRGFTDIDNFFKKRVNLRSKGVKILKNASKIVFLSENSKNNLYDNYIKDKDVLDLLTSKTVILPNGIDDIYYEKKGEKKSLPKNNLIKFIQVGKIMERKNQIISAKAIKEYSEKYNKTVEYKIVGDVNSQSYFNKLKELNYDFIKFIPNTNPEKLIELYRESDIFIMPSVSETFGLVYPEAMSQGLPIIYSKNQGFDGQFEEGLVGFHVQYDNIDEIVEKINKILLNYEEISENSLENYYKFNWDKIANSYLDIYKQQQ